MYVIRLRLNSTTSDRIKTILSIFPAFVHTKWYYYLANCFYTLLFFLIIIISVLLSSFLWRRGGHTLNA